ncbi:28129_t:CDS:2, partial [Gigaspora margarita]
MCDDCKCGSSCQCTNCTCVKSTKQNFVDKQIETDPSLPAIAEKIAAALKRVAN